MPSELIEIRVCVAALRRVLLRPSAAELEVCAPGLTAAAAKLASPSEAPDPSEAQALAIDLDVCRKFIEQGQTTSRVVAALIAGGYSAMGNAAPLTVAGTFSVAG